MNRYPAEFFDLQLRFARAVSSRLGMPFEEAVLKFTTMPKSLGLDDEQRSSEYVRGLCDASDPLDWTVSFYGREWSGGSKPQHRPFGCFYYLVRDEAVIRLHFVSANAAGATALGRAAMPARIAELAEMFLEIKEAVPEARTVQGHSWLYNLPAYCRLFSPAYTQDMESSTVEDDFNYLCLWGQFYTREWKVKQRLADELLAAANKIGNGDQLRECFQSSVLRPKCSVEEFYSFYGID